jgi:DNA polymerase III, gamma/tau subunits
MLDNFFGNPAAVQVFEHMIRDRRISQTILLAGPEGVGKATLARRFAGELLGDPARIERDDLFLPENASIVADREKWTAEKRNEDPLLFSSHPDFVTFAPMDRCARSPSSRCGI